MHVPSPRSMTLASSSRSTTSRLALSSSYSSSSSSGTDKTTTTTVTADSPQQQSPPPPSFQLAHRLQGLDQPTVWQEFSPLAVQHNAINLGQGFPDWSPPSFVIQSMEHAISPTERNANQYARSYAHLPLATVLADIYTRKWKTTTTPIDPATQIATATGCTNVLFCAIQGLVNPGDEVIMFEPAFDIYSSQVKMAGGIPIYVPLRPSKINNNNDNDNNRLSSASNVFTLDLEELKNAITSKTKVLLLNTPHNPTGKMFTLAEMQGIADIVVRHQQQQPITVIADEVYEHIIFDPHNEPHISMATVLPQQTLTLSSAGKTFSATGWKVGWAVGPPHLVAAVTAVQQWVNFSAATPNQDAIATSLLQAEQPYTCPNTDGTIYSTYYAYLAAEYKRKRGLLIEALESAGMTPIVPPGGFFIMADTSQIDFPYVERYQSTVTAAMPSKPMPRDWALSRWLTEDVGVTAIPPSAFYSPSNIGLAQNMLRFAFCKSDDTIREAHRRLEQYFGGGRR